jgi:hypothetical protein
MFWERPRTSRRLKAPKGESVELYAATPRGKKYYAGRQNPPRKLRPRADPP